VSWATEAVDEGRIGRDGEWGVGSKCGMVKPLIGGGVMKSWWIKRLWRRWAFYR